MSKRISIHALREEGDTVPGFQAAHFLGFLSTPSARRATGAILLVQAPEGISIHALREEGDANRMELELPYHQFLSTPSARRATAASDCKGAAL